jgi:lysophospholipase L1-like esterase
MVPMGVRLEVVGNASAVEIDYFAATDDLSYRDSRGGSSFSVWRGSDQVDERRAERGHGRLRLELGSGSGLGPGLGPNEDRAVIYLPGAMRPAVLGIRALDGQVGPAPRQPRWVCYGDSIAEGWVTSSPALAWPAVAGRMIGLDTINCGYAGAGRGETVLAEQIGRIATDAISITHGTNCWSRTPHTVAQMRANTEAFLHILRSAHPDVPILVGSAIPRPDAEATPNAVGATLAGLRDAMEDVVRERIAAGDQQFRLVPGPTVFDPALLADGIHPGDEGHQVLARAYAEAVQEMRAIEAPALRAG